MLAWVWGSVAESNSGSFGLQGGGLRDATRTSTGAVAQRALGDPVHYALARRPPRRGDTHTATAEAARIDALIQTIRGNDPRSLLRRPETNVVRLKGVSRCGSSRYVDPM